MENQFCIHCGYRLTEGERFCRNCGQAIPLSTHGTPAQATTSMSKRQYFKECCSAEAKIREKWITALGICCVVAQAVLSVLASVWILILREAFSRAPMFAGSSMGIFGFLGVLILIAAALSCTFTVAGIKSKRTGFFWAASPFAVIASIISTAFVFGSGAPARLALFVVLALYIIIIVLRCKNNKEYRICNR